MTAEPDLLPLPEPDATIDLLNHSTSFHSSRLLLGKDVDVYYAAHAQAYARANVAHATAPLQAEVEALRAEVDALREALEEIRSRSAMNLAMHPDPFVLTARLGDIYQIADAAL